MNEETAYKWAGQATRHIDGLVEPHIGQRELDSVASAILEAHKKGEATNRVEVNKMGFLSWSPCLYMGPILCADCDSIECDMKEGRVLHQQMFEQGFKYAKQQTSLNHCDFAVYAYDDDAYFDSYKIKGTDWRKLLEQKVIKPYINNELAKGLENGQGERTEMEHKFVSVVPIKKTERGNTPQKQRY